MAPISVMSVPVSELRPRFSWVRSVSRPNLAQAGEMRQERGLNRGSQAKENSGDSFRTRQMATGTACRYLYTQIFQHLLASGWNL